MSDQSEMIIGIVSGIATSAILYVAAKFTENTIIPAFRNLFYRGVDASGVWHWENKFGSTAKMDIKQYADKIEGTYTYVSSERRDIKNYKIQGNIQDRFLQLALRCEDQQRLGVLSYVFEIVGDGGELRGCSTFYSTNSHEISSENESFFRNQQQAKEYAEQNKIETQKFLTTLNALTSEQQIPTPPKRPTTSHADNSPPTSA